MDLLPEPGLSLEVKARVIFFLLNEITAHLIAAILLFHSRMHLNPITHEMLPLECDFWVVSQWLDVAKRVPVHQQAITYISHLQCIDSVDTSVSSLDKHLAHPSLLLQPFYWQWSFWETLPMMSSSIKMASDHYYLWSDGIWPLLNDCDGRLAVQKGWPSAVSIVVVNSFRWPHEEKLRYLSTSYHNWFLCSHFFQLSFFQLPLLTYFILVPSRDLVKVKLTAYILAMIWISLGGLMIMIM